MKNSCSLLQRHLQICILRQNVFTDLNVQDEQIISPFQRMNKGTHIVLVGLFLLLILFVLKQHCSGCNSFTLWYKLMIFGMQVYYHKMLYHGSSWPSHDLDLRSQGQIIEFREFSYPGCNSFILWYRLMIFGIWVYYNKMLYHGSSRPSHALDLRSKGQIIEFKELPCPGCNFFFIFWHGLMIFGM
jgi:hypothetical protein